MSKRIIYGWSHQVDNTIIEFNQLCHNPWIAIT